MPKRNSKVDDDDIIQRLVDGHSIQAIADLYGVDRSLIDGRIERVRLKQGAQNTIHLVALLVAKREYIPMELEGCEVA